MEEFEFYVDRKVTLWRRESFTMKAQTRNQAISIAIKRAKAEEIEDFECEELWDTCEDLSVRDNNFQATQELYIDESRAEAKLLWDNTQLND